MSTVYYVVVTPPGGTQYSHGPFDTRDIAIAYMKENVPKQISLIFIAEVSVPERQVTVVPFRPRLNAAE